MISSEQLANSKMNARRNNVFKKGRLNFLKNSEKRHSKTGKSGNQNPIHITIVGAPKVGKSALAVRLLTNRFIGEYASNVTGVYEKRWEKFNKKHVLFIKDLNIYTPGDISYNTMWSDAVLLVYSHADATSLKIATCFSEQIERAAISMRIRPPIIWLVGNKADQGSLKNHIDRHSLQHECDGFSDISVKEDAPTEIHEMIDDIVAITIKRKIQCEYKSSNSSLNSPLPMPRRSKSFDALHTLDRQFPAFKAAKKNRGSFSMLFWK